MKLTTNLSRYKPLNLQWIAAGMLMSVLVLLCLLILQLFQSFSSELSEEQATQLEHQKIQLQQHINKQRRQDNLSLSGRQLDNLKHDVLKINQLSTTQGLDLSTVLSHIEQAVPTRVGIQLIHFDAEQGTTRLVAEAGTTDDLNNFVDALQQSAQFRDVVVSDQKQIKQDRKTVFNYQVSFKQLAE